ncbi:MAG: hypothetical protein ACRD1B_03390 [Thermoanaerobaculia bacterium]
MTISGPALPEGRTTATQPDGSFSFADVPEGQGYQLRATSWNGRPTTTQPDGSFSFADVPEGEGYHGTATGGGIADGQIVMNNTPGSAAELVTYLNQLAKDLHAVNAQLDGLNASLGRAASHIPADHPAADAVDDIKGYASDVQDHTHEANAGVAKLLGLVGGFVAGWKVGGFKH